MHRNEKSEKEEEFRKQKTGSSWSEPAFV